MAWCVGVVVLAIVVQGCSARTVSINHVEGDRYAARYYSGGLLREYEEFSYTATGKMRPDGWTHYYKYQGKRLVGTRTVEYEEGKRVKTRISGSCSLPLEAVSPGPSRGAGRQW